MRKGGAAFGVTRSPVGPPFPYAKARHPCRGRPIRRKKRVFHALERKTEPDDESCHSRRPLHPRGLRRNRRSRLPQAAARLDASGPRRAIAARGPHHRSGAAIARRRKLSGHGPEGRVGGRRPAATASSRPFSTASTTFRPTRKRRADGTNSLACWRPGKTTSWSITSRRRPSSSCPSRSGSAGRAW